MIIKPDDLTAPEIIRFMHQHMDQMLAQTPAGSVHALDIDALRHPDIAFWSAWIDDELAGCGALKHLTAEHAEIKSMRTASKFRRRGVARNMLNHIENEARRKGYKRLSLETGALAEFESARRLYSLGGYEFCERFGSYRNDPNSAFMTRLL